MANTSRIDIDVDKQGDFEVCFAKLKDVKTKNFMVCFNAAKAVCRVDADEIHLEHFLSSPNKDYSTRWINFWGWDHGRTSFLDVIAKRYDLSPRLLDLLWPKIPPPKASKTPASNSSGSPTSFDDIELGLSPVNSASRSGTGDRQIPLFAHVVDRLWHFCSVDRGEHYLYVGFNALVAATGQKPSVGTDRPTGHRIWTSLLLCDDGTVFSIFEDPPVGSNDELIHNIRWYVLDIFQQQSHRHSSPPSSSLGRVTVRPTDATQPATHEAMTEMTSLLFYYLFDDWLTSYSLIAQRDHLYRAELEEIRTRMFKAADVSLIESLHQLGRQLTVLKLMYKSYESIIRRILQRRRSYQLPIQEPVNGFHNSNAWYNTAVPGAFDSPSVDPLAYEQSPISPGGISKARRVTLASPAVFRFERLLDRIQLLAQTEIDECIREKESLTFMNFNLVALKESQAVEKLTRTTIFLAKATVLFLPVSLLTSYFSIQVINNTGSNLKTYWLSFLVVGLLTILLLSVTGFVNSKALGGTVYRSLTKIFLLRITEDRKGVKKSSR
ncbi:hypothetical protein D6D15_03169 [Aureobasidium pullulans]|uniref:ADP-ribosylation factor n=1 Tax=Aureobasidium pullulans TaxID=5580 RepID=A0A4S9BGE3_AURPU|nr:hypothetical protein D6D15_03169 [Aureobasidium pullulans]